MEDRGEVCVRPGPARLLLAGLGLLGLAAGGVGAFVLGDRNAGNDSATVLMAVGALTVGGAVLGSIAGRLGADGPPVRGRVRPPTLGLSFAPGGSSVRGESVAPILSGTFAPNLFLDAAGSRIRWFGHLGGTLGSTRDLDPRPQAEGRVVRRARGLSFGTGLDLAVALPYAGTRGGLGRVELRFRPEIQVRREWIDLLDRGERHLERIMLLPLTVGLRWHLAPRQRFTLYVGPRFDFVSVAGVEPEGQGRLRRGGALRAPLYAEAWYGIDVPFTARPRRDGASRRVEVNGLFEAGYVHSRFDGAGLDFGPVVGFLGPVHLSWHTRVRPRGAPAAFQAAVAAVVGDAFALAVQAGVVLGDLRGHR